MRGIKCPNDRWAWVEISLSALRKNTRAYRNLIHPKSLLMCVVKADAYGHGAVACAKTMISAGADQFAVATVKEARTLREAGITKPVLVLNEPPITCVEELVAFDIMPSVYSVEFALALGEEAARQQKVAKYHLAIDTGMTRIGVLWSEVVEFCQTIDFHAGLERAGLFTHFATADVVDDWDFALQHSHFTQALKALRSENIPTGLVHCNNTSATMLHPETQFDMCRVGVGLYGMYPAQTTEHVMELEPVMSVKARITRVHDARVGDGVSYGLTYRVVKQKTQIATIPLGYADGLSRTLSNKMYVLCNGYAYRQVGRICMDQTMFSVEVNPTKPFNPVYPVHFGDVVTIMGRDGNMLITAEDIAGIQNTINYEITCDFGMRLEKVYV